MDWVKKGHEQSHIFVRASEKSSLQDLWRGLLLEDFSLKNGLTLDELLSLGSVYINQARVTNINSEIFENDLVEIYRKPKRYTVPDLYSRVVHDEKDFLIVHKPANLPCHPTVDNFEENLLTGYRKLLGENIFLPHRLDVATEGLMILARSEQALTKIAKLFSTHQITKKYLVLVESSWKNTGLLTHFMKPDARAPKTLSRNRQDSWKECKLDVEQIDDHEFFSLLQVNLLTGRTHQIRAQLAFEGHPISGDTLYGNPETIGSPLGLCCCELSFAWPIGDDTKVQMRTFSLWNQAGFPIIAAP